MKCCKKYLIKFLYFIASVGGKIYKELYRRNEMKKLSILICFITLLCFPQGCSKNNETPGGIVTFIHGSLKINNQDAAMGSRIQKGDMLLTGGNSLAVVQISQTAVITLRAGTELKFDDLLNNQNETHTILLNLTKGSTFHKVIRKGSDYSVKTPTIVASVRGTSFEVNTEDNKSRVSLLNGKVKVTTLGSEIKEAELAPGQYLDADTAKAGVISQLTAEDRERLAQLDSISAVTEVEKFTPENGNIVIPDPVKEKLLNEENTNKPSDKTSEIKKTDFTPDAKALSALIKKENRTVADIKAVFNRIDEIRLFSGRVIQGAISERGEQYSVITTAGIIRISEKEIKTVNVIK